MQPGAKGRLASEQADFLPGPYKDILRDLVRMVVAQHATYERMGTRHVPPIQPFESPCIAPGCKDRIRAVGFNRHAARPVQCCQNAQPRSRLEELDSPPLQMVGISWVACCFSSRDRSSGTGQIASVADQYL